MPSFSRSSLQRLETCHPALQRLFRVVIERVDCAILVGHRGQAEQMQVYREGLSQLFWPKSKHNVTPSNAVDVAPYHTKKPHIRWTDKNDWYWFGGYVRGIADEMGIGVRWGGDWDGDRDWLDSKLIDLPHWEILEEL